MHLKKSLYGANYPTRVDFLAICNINHTKGLRTGLSCKSFFQILEEEGFGLINQKLFPFKRMVVTQAIQRDPKELNKSQTSLATFAMFQEVRSFKPKPPSILGKHTLLHLTLAPSAVYETPFHRKEEHSFSIALITFLGRRKTNIQ